MVVITHRSLGDYIFIPRSTIKKLLKEAGAKRVSDDAMNVFHTSINKMAFQVASRAVLLAKHAKRKTVSPSDVKLAISTAD